MNEKECRVDKAVHRRVSPANSSEERKPKEYAVDVARQRSAPPALAKRRIASVSMTLRACLHAVRITVR